MTELAPVESVALASLTQAIADLQDLRATMAGGPLTADDAEIILNALVTGAGRWRGAPGFERAHRKLQAIARGT